MNCILMIIIIFFSSDLWAANTRLELLKLHYFFNDDSTYTLTVTEQVKALTQFGAKDAQKNPITYYPDSETFQLLKAYVIKANGKTVPVDSSQIFTRSASDDSQAPGFSDRMTTTVVYPTLSAKDSTYLSYQIIRKKPSQIGFSVVLSPSFGMVQDKQIIELNIPKEMSMRWSKQGDFKVTDKSHARRRLITASLLNQDEKYAENNMADLGQNLPYFIASDSKSWESIGSRFWDLSKDKIEVTPDITTLAIKLTKDKKGIEAARAIHNWVAKNIHYIAVYLVEGAGAEPHKASEVLANGYGDCKDKTILMISLLKAAGITAYPVLVNVGENFFNYPLPNANQFNHALVYIPSLNIFANPTSEYSSFGELDGYTSNKFALISGPNPTLSRTPEGDPDKSHYSCHKKISINERGDVTGQGMIELTGRVNRSCRELFSGAVLDNLAKQTLEETEGGTGKISASDPTDLDHNMKIHAEWISPEALNIDNETYFEIPVGIDFKNPRGMGRLIQVDSRKYATLIGAGLVTWNYEITVPKGYNISHLPKNTHFMNKAGRFDSEYLKHDNKLIVSRKFMINKDVFSNNEYPFLKELLYQPVKDSRSIVSIQKPSTR